MSNPREPEQKSKPPKLKDVFTQLSPDSGATGEDPAQKLFSALSHHFEPQDILEEIWLHDIARITANIEIFRIVERSVQYHYLKDRLTELKRKGAFTERQFSEATFGIYHMTIGEDGASKMPDLSTLSVVGALSQLQIRGLGSITDVIQKLQRERDRIYAQFERKRRPLVIASVKTVEAQVSAPNPTSNLAE